MIIFQVAFEHWISNLNKSFKSTLFLNHRTDSCVENSPTRKVLSWSERLSVLIGVAKAVHFLHTGTIPGFFSNRLKANNILLNEHRIAKLSDYGLSIISEETEKYVVRIIVLFYSFGQNPLQFFIVVLTSLDFCSCSYRQKEERAKNHGKDSLIIQTITFSR